jgi:hypothetical protein
VELDDALLNSPVAKEIQSHLENWIASRCPDHLGAIGEMNKN